MKKLFSWALIALLASVLLAAASTGCVSQRPSHVHRPGASEPKPEAAEKTPDNLNADKKRAEKYVSVQGGQFDPPELRVKVGDTVTWVNEDSNLHEVHADDDAFKGPTLKFGESFSQTFDGAGAFGYHDHLHEQLKGTIVVE